MDARQTHSFRDRVIETVRSIPAGKVASYGGVAAIAGRPRAARAVGGILSAHDVDSSLPWWRVINGSGMIPARGRHHAAKIQRSLLEREGVRFDARGRIDWDRFGWSGRTPARAKTGTEAAEAEWKRKTPVRKRSGSRAQSR